MEFITYCFDCLGMVFFAALGNNPKGMTLTDGFTGIITNFTLTGLLLWILWFIVVVANMFKKIKKLKKRLKNGDVSCK